MPQSTYSADNPPIVPDGLEPVPEQHTYAEPIDSREEPKDSKESVTPPEPCLGRGTQSPQKTTFRLRRTTFFLLELLILTIVAAAVSGGVGGSVAVREAYKFVSTPIYCALSPAVTYHFRLAVAV